MEGSHQKGSNWYRCQFVYRRGIAAADAAGHPRVLGIREEVVLEPLFDFLGRRLFGPDRLRLLHDELATVARQTATTAARRSSPQSSGSSPKSTRRSAGRRSAWKSTTIPTIPSSPPRRSDIEELAGQRAALDDQRRQLAAHRSNAPQPHEIEALLASVPDLRPALARYGPAELADLFDAFDVTVTYDKPSHSLELAATVTADLVPAPERLQPPRRRSQNCDIAGAGGTPPVVVNAKLTGAQSLWPHTVVAATVMSAGAEMLSVAGGGGGGGGVGPPGVTVTVNDAVGVESPTESCARQLTWCEPTVNRLPE